ncbi:MAG: pilus assembly protein PilB [Acidobacteria bacterium]|nr:MAG: pilus assembly protein PilB [Acidobacteriota bacterium]PYV26302.1 MAG: pilus assembly protein PilB [Acidobacteriota bacterium]
MAETLTLDAELEQAKELAQRYQFEFIDLRDFRPDLELLRSIPLEYMVHYEFLPLEAPDHSLLVIAVADPTDLARLDELEAKLDRRLVVKVAAPSQVRDFLKKTDPSQRVLDKATEDFRVEVIHDEENGEPGLSLEEMVQDREVSPMIRLVDSIIFAALERRASDIHIESRDDSVAVKYRVDGVLQPALAPLASEHQSTLITRIKVMAELDIAERRVPQDGRFRVRYRGRPIDFRVSIMPSINGEDAVLRILDKESLSEKFRSLRLDVLGHSERELKRLRRFIREPYGMVLVTGPTGSGKTTTLYAALSEIKSEEDKIITIEDPVEYQIRGITQIPVNEKKGLTFARGLRSILRHDPDKIMVGEIRDNETAQIAIQSALTGHLVFTTVHANNVVDVLGRFLNMGVEPYNFVSALNCILAQRLVRLICEPCKRPVETPVELFEESGIKPEEWQGVVFYEGAGCPRCNQTGFRGRTAVGELLELSDRIRELILDKRPSSEIRRAAHDEGMVSLRESALERVRLGLTTLKEINKVTFVE